MVIVKMAELIQESLEAAGAENRGGWWQEQQFTTELLGSVYSVDCMMSSMNTSRR